MGRCSSLSLSLPLLHFLLALVPLFFVSSSEQAALKDVSLDNPIIHLIPSPHAVHSCERVHVTGISRLNLKSYASMLHVYLKVSEAMPERIIGKLEIFFHSNLSIGLCQWENEKQEIVQNGQWSAVLSPYENRYIDVKFKDKATRSITVSVEEEFQQWRLISLGLGLLLLLMAPIVSNWVPFYYSSSMVFGVLLVVLLILFQGMKLLPMGRKNILYLTLYGSLVGVGSYIVHYFSTIVNSILLSFGLSEEMHNPVSIFLLVGIILAGAALGYWIVRKFLLSEDGSIDAGIAQFVKWAMRVIGLVFVFESSVDTVLALAALVICWSISSLINSRQWRNPVTLQHSHLKNENLWQQRTRQSSANNKHAEFLSRSARKDFATTVWGSAGSPYTPSKSPAKGQVYASSRKKLLPRSEYESYYSSFHKKMPTRKFSKSQWEDFTRESTKEALAEWASTPEVAKWVGDNAHHMRLGLDSSSSCSMASSSGSSEETAVENDNGLSFFKWY